jgi:hypothetical protein
MSPVSSLEIREWLIGDRIMLGIINGRRYLRIISRSSLMWGSDWSLQAVERVPCLERHRRSSIARRS